MTLSSSLFRPESWSSQDTKRAFNEALRICDRLQTAGHVAHLAGGCVRDTLLGREPKDFDVATNAVPDRVREIFGRRKTLAFGASFGVIGVLPEKSAAHADSVTPTEVATFRSDGEYTDGRRPNHVTYGDAANDALRRDFTINGLFYDPVAQRVIDYVEGEADLRGGILKTIGDPDQRFGEDKLRMLRAVRFATTLGFAVDPATKASITGHADDIHMVSSERIGAEMRRVLTADRAIDGIRLLIELGLHRRVWHDVAEFDLVKLDAWLEHRTTGTLEETLALVLLTGEDPESGLADLSQRWRLSNEETRAVESALRNWHLMASLHQRPWSEVQPALIHRDATTILQVATAVVAAQEQDETGVLKASDALTWPAEQLDPPPLISGDTLRERGFRPGPEFRHFLQSVRDHQLDGKITTAEEALGLVKKLAEDSGCG